MRFEHYRGIERPRFAHPSELELALLLDRSGIAWEYEPHTFPLERAADGRVTEAFTPDFYVPDVGIYVECTTTHPSLMSRKRRKVRRATESHDLVVTLHGRGDCERLVRKYRLTLRHGLGLKRARLLCGTALHPVRAVLHRRVCRAAS